MKPRVTNPVVPLAIILLIALIFILDRLTPLGVAVWMLYLLPLLLPPTRQGGDIPSL